MFLQKGGVGLGRAHGVNVDGCEVEGVGWGEEGADEGDGGVMGKSVEV